MELLDAGLTHLGDDSDVRALDAGGVIDRGGQLAVAHTQDPSLLSSLSTQNMHLYHA